MATFNRILSQSLQALIRLYRFLLSPWVGRHCRFQPTCSAYALEALSLHGPWKGSFLSLRRLLCCHPWHSGGIDFVPLKK